MFSYAISCKDPEITPAIPQVQSLVPNTFGWCTAATCATPSLPKEVSVHHAQQDDSTDIRLAVSMKYNFFFASF